MPTVPRLPEQSVQQSGVPGVRVSTDAPLEAFGGGNSTAGVFGAAQGIADTAQKIGFEEKKKADQVAFLSADKQAADLETKLQVDVQKMRGRDAFGAPDYAAKTWQDSVQKIRDSLSNNDQRMAFDRSVAGRWESLNKNVQMHMAGESRQLDENETQGFLATSRNAAVLNSYDDQRVELEKQRQRDALVTWAQRNGVYQDAKGELSETFKARAEQELSATNRDVIQSRIDADKIDMAKSFFEANKTQMTAQDIVHVQKLLEHSEVIAQGNDAWNEVKGMTLSDGTPDERRMEAKIMAGPGSDERKLKILDYVKARAGEQLANRRREEASNDRDFMNNAIQIRQSGQPLSEALKSVDKYAIDDADAAAKTAAIQKMYAPPSESDPQKYMALYDATQTGAVDKHQLADALRRGDISTKDWETLEKERLKISQEGVSPAQKVMWETIKENAGTAITDKKELAVYLTAVQKASQGKPPEEMYKISQDLLKKDPKTQTTIPWVNWSFGGQTQYKSDTEKSNAAALTLGAFQQDVGPSVAAAIGQGIQSKGKKSVEPQDIDAFAQEFGGYDKIQPGTPAHNAISVLMQQNKPVTPANVKAVLRVAPDGKYTGKIK